MATDPYRYFRIEVRDLLQQMSAGVLALERAPHDQHLPARILRLAHTLKGAARVVRQGRIAEIAHLVEDVLAPLREGRSGLAPDGAQTLLSLLDELCARLAELPPPGEAHDSTAAASLSLPSTGVSRVDLPQLDTLIATLNEAGTELAALRGSMGALRSELAGGIERVDRELRQARDTAEQLRLLPLSSVLGVLERSARDAAQAAGKQVSFEARGGDVRLDSAVIDALRAPLVQLVRNAVAHGIEAPQERLAAGKPAAGQVCVEAVQRGHHVFLRCRDDGSGVDIDAVRRAIARRGPAGLAASELGRAEVLASLLDGGISTSAKVTELAGRGVGLDLVRDAVQRLGGAIEVQTESGCGTTIELKVPVWLSVLEVLSVETGGQRAAIPLSAVRRVLRVAPEDVAYAPAGATIMYEGKSLALRPLRLGRRQARHGPPGAISAVVAHAAGDACALRVDRLLSVDTILARPLPPLALADPMVAGVYFDAYGTPCLLLDGAALAAQAHHTGESEPVVPGPRPVLVVDDSPTTRMLESSILTSAGFEVDLAACAEDALEMAQHRDYGLFLVDVEMPGLDGFGFIERLRTHPRLREVPCVLVSSRASPEDRRRGEAVGARAYIAKSEFEQSHFLRQVDELALR